jgi:2-keto-4-pentenoate hydratase/2-oxohepta-3-ene-1,7-dioic acid hydratase in catechol pathway
VVDLPDVVGHPAFPATMEALVSSRRGSVLDAARAALARDDAAEHVVSGAILLAPLVPASLRSDDMTDALRPVVGSDAVVPWPDRAGWLDYQPKIVAVIGAPISGMSPERAERKVFGYTLMNDWSARDANGDPAPDPEGLPFALGPCIVPAEELDPQALYISIRVDGKDWAKGNLNGAARNLASAISRASTIEPLEPAETFATSPFGGFGDDPARQLWPGADVELEAEGIGILRNRVEAPH